MVVWMSREFFSCASTQQFNFNVALETGKITKLLKGVRKIKKTFSVAVAGIQHKIPTNLEGVISETAGDIIFWKTCEIFLIFPTSFG